MTTGGTTGRLALQVDDRISVPGFQGQLREWQVDEITPDGALCHMVSAPKTQEVWPLDVLEQVGRGLRRPHWELLVP